MCNCLGPKIKRGTKREPGSLGATIEIDIPPTPIMQRIFWPISQIMKDVHTQKHRLKRGSGPCFLWDLGPHTGASNAWNDLAAVRRAVKPLLLVVEFIC